MPAPRVEASPWAEPCERAEALRERYPYAGELLTLYLALVDVWQDAWAAARAERPASLASWAAEHVLPRVVSATADAGPASLVEALVAKSADVDAATGPLDAWLAGADLPPVEHYLARACLPGPLVAVDAEAACAGDPSPRGDRRCPRCGGLPQLSVRADTGDRLVSGGRLLVCARCGESWPYSGSACASCGQSEGGQRTVYAEDRKGTQVGRRDTDDDATLPHLRVEACTQCRRYLIDVDQGREPWAVPEVDELVALPLDLYATEHGYTKVTPNLMGF